MKDPINCIAQPLVDHPQQFRVSEVEGYRTSVFEFKVAKEDLSKIIERQGRTTRALRTVPSAASAKLRKRIVLETIE